MNKEDMKRRLQEGLTTVERMRDEIRLEVHLAGMELKDKWKELEPRLEHARQVARDVSETSVHALDEVMKQFEDFRASMKQSINGAASKGKASRSDRRPTA